MDSSKQYIIMCKEAKEIQEIYQNILKKEDNEIDNILEGWYVYDGKNVILLHNNEFFISDLKDELKKYIWLPRQDQLQDLTEWIVEEFCKWYKSPYKYEINRIHGGFKEIYPNQIFFSMEQLTFAYVMYKKYNKIWNNIKRKWIKKENQNFKGGKND